MKPFRSIIPRVLLGLLLTLAGPALPVLAETWVKTTAPVANWSSLSCSADGTKIFAAAQGAVGAIYASTDSGLSWAQTGAPIGAWRDIVSSADGRTLAACALAGNVYTSTNGGETWQLSSIPDFVQPSLALSGDGKKIAAVWPGSVPSAGRIYFSADSGKSWLSKPVNFSPYYICCSADGVAFAVSTLSSIRRSGDFGETWQEYLAPGLRYRSVVLSSDGSTILAAGMPMSDFGLYASRDAGLTWTAANVPNALWFPAISADGRKLAAMGGGDAPLYYTSADAGATWVQGPALTEFGVDLALSADGNTAVTAVSGGGIYILQAAPHTVEFTYTTNNGTITITRYTGTNVDVVVPSTINGLPITAIADGVFGWNRELTSVRIPDSVTNFGAGVFSECTGLRDVTIGNGVSSIPFETFWGCTNLTNVTLGSNVASIGKGAFTSCSSLLSLNLPDRTTNIISDALIGCSGLKEINVGPFNPSFSSLDGVLFDKEKTTLIRFPGGRAGSYSIPETVTQIGDSAFESSTHLESITIPASVSIIGYNAFGFSGLTSVAIPNSVGYIPHRGFYSCRSLTNVVIPSSVTNIMREAFYYCSSLTSVTIPDSVTRIDNLAFQGCEQLTTVTVGNGVTEMGGGAFMQCINLLAVYFRGNAPTWGPALFLNDQAVKVFYLPGTSGWGAEYAGRPTEVWVNPTIQVQGGSLGAGTNGFAFRVIGTRLMTIEVEAASDPASPVWVGLKTHTFGDPATFIFTDPEWTNYPARFYRLRSP